MKFFVYAVKSLSKEYVYIGQTNNLVRRLKEHNNEETSSNRSYSPFKLIYYEEHNSRTLVVLAEKELKRGCRREELRRYAYHGEIPKWLKGLVC